MVQTPAPTYGVLQMDQYLLRINDVAKITQRSKSSIYRGVAAGAFPAPVKIGARSSAWRIESVRSWLDRLTPAPK